MGETFEEFMSEEGAGVFEEVMNWLEEAPEPISTAHLLGKSHDEYALDVCMGVYNGN